MTPVTLAPHYPQNDHVQPPWGLQLLCLPGMFFNSDPPTHTPPRGPLAHFIQVSAEMSPQQKRCCVLCLPWLGVIRSTHRACARD